MLHYNNTCRQLFPYTLSDNWAWVLKIIHVNAGSDIGTSNIFSFIKFRSRVDTNQNVCTTSFLQTKPSPHFTSLISPLPVQPQQILTFFFYLTAKEPLPPSHPPPYLLLVVAVFVVPIFLSGCQKWFPLSALNLCFLPSFCYKLSCCALPFAIYVKYTQFTWKTVQFYWTRDRIRRTFFRNFALFDSYFWVYLSKQLTC